MSLRDVFIKAKEFGFRDVAVLSERNGNPNGMEVYRDGEFFLSLELTVDLSPPKGRMKKSKLALRCDSEDFKDLAASIFGLSPETDYSKTPQNNLLWIKKAEDKKSKALMEFYDASGKITSPRVYIKDWKLAGDENERSEKGRC